VENAIRSGVMNHKEETLVELSGKFKNGKITFTLTGNRALSQQHLPMTKGMENLKIRLQKLYGTYAELTIGGEEEDDFASKLTIPGKNQI
jgi:LytS/YehU family sensor histidine kinase